jgi:phytoene dehydrogenase-like protein
MYSGVDQMTDEADAIVVGTGINGLVSAAELAQSGGR